MQNNKAPSNSSSLSMNDFEIISKIGKGSFGVVYKVKKRSNKTIYVVKQINISSMKSKMRSIALNEVKILKSLENPYIVKYYDSFIERDQLNIIMEYCEGGDLAQYIKSHVGKQVSEAKIWKFFIQMCIGLDFIHNKKILHRDIKSLNIFLTKDGDIRIGDLGVAKVLADSVNFAQTMVGTPYYLSPEMCEEKPYNEKSDIWALGCVLYELCVQKHPFQAHSQGTLILKIIKGKYSPISGSYSQELIEIVNLCLNKDYKKRPTASSLLSKPSVIEKAKSLNISLHTSPRETEAKPKKVPEPALQIKEVKEIPASVSKDLVVRPMVVANKIEKKVVKNNNEGKIHVFMQNELKKVENENKPAAVINNNKIEFKNPAPPNVGNQKPVKENIGGIEIVAKAISDKKPNVNIVVGEKVVNKPFPKPVDRDDKNVQRVRKPAPVDLAKQAKNIPIVQNQQKLVKKVNVEPPKISRPPLLEDKEKAPKIKSPTEIPSLEKKKASQENIEITAEELNEVKNLPDVVVPQKGLEKNKEPRISTKESVEEEVKMKYEKKNPPSYQKPVAAEISSKKKEIIIENEENEVQQQQPVEAQKIKYSKEEDAWKVSNEERNLKVVKRTENQPDEELKQGEYYIAEDENQEEDAAEVEQADEESSDEEEDEEENVDSTAPSEKALEVDRSVLVKKLEKSLKKKQKIQHLIVDIKSNKYIKALGDKVFGDIINFFKIKLESEDEINEDDQDEIEHFLQGKLSPEIQVQVIYNIYRLLGLQIELQKCEASICEVQKYF